jgi:hypothetical protein
LKLAKTLILDELFDLLLYQKLRSISDPDLQKTLEELISIEVRHFAFWQDFFQLELPELGLGRRIKFWLIVAVYRIFGAPAADLALEAIEVYGIRKYLDVWERYQAESLGSAVRGVLEDEFGHEDLVVTRLKERMINPDRIRNIFLGVNDGMVEILGAVSGFFASLGQNTYVLVAGLTTAVAGSIAMAAPAPMLRWAPSTKSGKLRERRRRLWVRKRETITRANRPSNPECSSESVISSAHLFRLFRYSSEPKLPFSRSSAGEA